VPLRRPMIDRGAEARDLDALDLAFDCIDDEACALLGFQRTKHISIDAQAAWQRGDRAPLIAEAKARRREIILGAFLEIYREYLPTRRALGGREVRHVCDIGCGQALNDVLLHKDYRPKFTLVDIERTERQYHNWAKDGSGYASLAAARALLVENGAAETDITLCNPAAAQWVQTGHGFDLVTSLYSCGFHYPVDAYLDLFLDTIGSGGAVVLDLRKGYATEEEGAIAALTRASETTEIYHDRKSVRMLFEAPASVARR